MNVPAYVLRMKQRWVERGLPDYPMWIAGVIDSAALVTAVMAVGQRGTDALPWTALLASVALLPWVLELWGQGATWPFFVVLTGGSVVALTTAYPVEYDFAPLLLVLMVGHVTACAGVQRALTVLVAGLGIVVGLGISGHLPASAATIWTASMVVALDIGFVLRSQQLRIESQEREHTAREQQAVLEERQRIARDVHDLVAHSLSVTMLHLTAARRDLEDGGDAAEVVESLREAERVGRQAMSDVRRSVGLLGTGGHLDPPAPTVEDVAALVAEFRAAGMDVSLETAGDLAQVPPATGLALYRLVQESLTNVARHSPHAAASVTLDVGSDPGRLVVRNGVPDDAVRSPGGSGLRGMAQRAELLGATLVAGRQGSDWVVRLDLPRGDAARDEPEHGCPLPGMVRGLPRPAVGSRLEST